MSKSLMYIISFAQRTTVRALVIVVRNTGSQARTNCPIPVQMRLAPRVISGTKGVLAIAISYHSLLTRQKVRLGLHMSLGRGYVNGCGKTGRSVLCQ
ncbi:MAG: hypothetical protein WBG95_09205 [Sulfitobacter sp.]